jgi:hypothetical protein
MRPLPVLLDTFGFPTTDRTGTWAFDRREIRHSVKQRLLDCGHRIDPTEPYEYFVGKLWGETYIVQRRDCDVCMRRGHSY